MADLMTVQVSDTIFLIFTCGLMILFEQCGAGLDGFDKNGIDLLNEWLIEMEIKQMANTL